MNDGLRDLTVGGNTEDKKSRGKKRIRYLTNICQWFSEQAYEILQNNKLY